VLDNLIDKQLYEFQKRYNQIQENITKLTIAKYQAEGAIMVLNDLKKQIEIRDNHKKKEVIKDAKSNTKPKSKH